DADSRILEDLRQAEPFHLALGGDALTLRLETEATIGLFVAGDSDVAEGVFHGVAYYFTPGRGQESPERGCKLWSRPTPWHWFARIIVARKVAGAFLRPRNTVWPAAGEVLDRARLGVYRPRLPTSPYRMIP